MIADDCICLADRSPILPATIFRGRVHGMSAAHRPPAPATLRLYIAGSNPGARRAFEVRARLIAEMAGAIDIEIVDILEYPEKAEEAGILATPTLSDDSVTPPRRLIGDISDTAQVLAYFGYSKKDVNP
jgi:circadian clock protein KaiB